MTAHLLEAAPVGGFSHEVVFYRDEDDFLARVLPFVREGLEGDEEVVVAEPEPRLDLLRDALADDARAVTLLDMADIGANPARIIAVWEAAVDEHIGAGRGLRGVGEPAYVGRSDVELAECQLHEVLLNPAFSSGPGWRLLCPYDEQLPPAVRAGALTSHPVRLTPTGGLSSDAHDPAAHVGAFAALLPAPPGTALRSRYRDGDVPAVRRAVAGFATGCGLSRERMEDLELAASELATNSIRHGGGSGSLVMWAEPGAAVVEFTDGGRVADPLTGRRRPSLDQIGGRGLYLVNQLTDLVQLRSGPDGTTVRLTTWR
ncbi:sensor histidine kinase [Geodermatophilus sp. YIM 151500]|uniref:sensor histidine kinase n=1 Tax=Geodermatophilus sp. YIM 151500 TaxID=2984531 RepID=UPI0021E3B49C|nr:sensor histidine kinase [Geodermatophilus sp. YIM 151500]MCV2490938.1 sensor histidine kinase [Geodermatophilus sp. YIM 151500]